MSNKYNNYKKKKKIFLINKNNLYTKLLMKLYTNFLFEIHKFQLKIKKLKK